ncbi:hypothetical protein VM95_37650, partial [Streptomyces rubellomurinus]
AVAVRARLTFSGTETVRVEVTDVTGRPVLSVASLSLRPLAVSAVGRVESLFRVDWVPAEVGGSLGEWAVVGDCEAVGGRRFADLGALAASGFMPAVVVLPVAGEVAEVLPVVQRWLAERRWDGARLVVVTRGAAVEAGAAGVWGLVRSVQAEEPGRVVLLDLDGSVRSLEALPGALAAGEPQAALRDGEFFVPRLGRVDHGELLPVPLETPWRVDAVTAGTLDGLGVLAVEPRAPGPGEVRVEIRAAGVNFRDVLGALGMYPGEIVLGSEFAGVVVEVGQGVDQLTVGDRVFGMARGTFGSECVVDARLVARIPCGWSFVRAASVPVVFLTAFYGLVELGGLRSGESV